MKDALYATMTVTEVSVPDSTSADNGENLLQSAEDNTDANADTNMTTDVDTNMDTNADGMEGGENTDVPVDNVDADMTNVDGESMDIGGDTEPGVDDMNIDASNSEMEGLEGSDMYTDGAMVDMSGMDGDMTASTTKDPFLSSYVPIVGISAATLVVGAILGVLLAKKKIKKGIDLYED